MTNVPLNVIFVFIEISLSSGSKATKKEKMFHNTFSKTFIIKAKPNIVRLELVFQLEAYCIVHPFGTAFTPLFVQEAAMFFTNVPVGDTSYSQFAV